MARRTAAVAAVSLCLFGAGCSADPGPRPTAVVSTSAADPYGLSSVAWPQDDDAATAWLGRLPETVGDLSKVSADQRGDGFDFVVYRSGPEEDDRSISWAEGGELVDLLGVLDFGEGAVPCEDWASSPSLTPLAGLAGPDLNRAVSALPDPLPEPVPWFTCTFTTDVTGEVLDDARQERLATWVSGGRSFTVATYDTAERDALVRAAVDAAASSD